MMEKMNFQQRLLQLSVLHGSSEIIQKCGFTAQEKIKLI